MAKNEVSNHILVPKHSKLGEKEKKELFEQFSARLKDLPRISKEDPAIQNLGVSEGDIIKILRPSITAGETVFYRRVV